MAGKRKRNDSRGSLPETEIAKRTWHSLSKKELSEVDNWIKDHSMPENQRNLTIADMQQHVTKNYGFQVGFRIAA